MSRSNSKKINSIDGSSEQETFSNYKEVIKGSFMSWGGNYKESEHADFGYDSVNVTIKLSEGLFPSLLNVTIVNTDYPKDKERHASNVNNRNWTINSVGSLIMYNHYQEEKSGKVVDLNRDDYIRHAMHEFGHLLGLGDAYNGAVPTDEVSEKDVMWNGTDISENDIEMVLLAVLKNEKQYFYSDGSKVISDAISIRKEV